VNCQLYRGWRLGKRKPGIIPDGKGLVEAAGESFEVRSVALRGDVGVGAREGDSASVVDLRDETFWEEAVGLGESGSSSVREGGGYVLCKSMGSRVVIVANKRRGAKGRDNGVFISLFTSLATSVAEAPFPFRFFLS